MALTDTSKQPFRFRGREVFSDIKTQTPRAVPDADTALLNDTRRKMEERFGNARLPAIIYKGVTYPERELGEFIVPLGIDPAA